MGYYQTNHAGSRTGTASRTRRNAYPRFSQARLGHRYYSPGIGGWLSRDPVYDLGGVEAREAVHSMGATSVQQLRVSSVTFAVVANFSVQARANYATFFQDFARLTRRQVASWYKDEFRWRIVNVFPLYATLDNGQRVSYSLEIAREFTQGKPLAVPMRSVLGEEELYAYVANNPVNRFDILGLGCPGSCYCPVTQAKFNSCSAGTTQELCGKQTCQVKFSEGPLVGCSWAGYN